MNDASEAQDAGGQEIAEALERLLLDDSGIGEIEAELGGFNIFDAMGNARRESLHSDFLAFLLDPNETHGLGAAFLTRLLATVPKGLRGKSDAGKVDPNALLDLEGCRVMRERHRIDVLCVNETSRFLLAIENKVGSGEGKNQLERYRAKLEEEYPDFRRVFIYLSPEGRNPSEGNDAWAPIGYDAVSKIVESLARERSKTPGDTVAVTLNHYVNILRRHVVADDDLVKVAQKLYEKHSMAFDYIIEHKPDGRSEISKSLVECARHYEDKEVGKIEIARSAKTYINFFPTELENFSELKSKSDNSVPWNRYSLLFEIMNLPTSLTMLLVIGPSENDRLRRILFQCAKDNSDVFGKSREQLSENYTRIYSSTWITRGGMDKINNGEDFDKIRDETLKKFKEFMDGDFEKIVAALAKALQETSADELQSEDQLA